MTTIREKYELEPVVSYAPKLEQHPLYRISSKEIIGIEVEVENVNHRVNPIPKHSLWSRHGDGSLRNSGAEYVTKPMMACYAPEVLDELMSGILNQDCCFSPRTSVHVHLNVQDLETHQVTDLVLLYTVFEKLLYKFAGRGRIKNIYCVPIMDTDLLVDFVSKGPAKVWSKYTGLNLCPISRNRDGAGYGTIEFRHMHGTFDVSKLCNWIILITKLKEYVMKTDTKDIRKMILDMDDNFNFDRLLKDIFQEHMGLLELCSFSEIQAGYMAAKSAFIPSNVRVRASEKSPYFLFKGTK